jgi:hypothetical protein
MGDTAPRNNMGQCPQGYTQEFNAVENIHIGIITSSLGHHGSKDVCSEMTEGRTPDDKAQLLPSVRPAADPPVTSWDGSGFLVWDPRGNDGTIDNPHIPPGWGSPMGPGDANDLVAAFQNQVRAAGELGCGYEQQLESWYRFLIDPEPVDAMDNNGTASVRVKDAMGKTIANQVVLQQRAAFLRRDSLLAIIMLTDENDCSILDEDGSQGWLVAYKGGPTVNNWRMPASTNSCKQDPNGMCCRPCIVPAAGGCGDNAAEGCPESGYLAIADDSMNQRCFNQTQRFGINLLYPTWRYSDAITRTTVDPRMTGAAVPNPLYTPGPNGEPAREQGLVFLAGIVGVPWQDIATDGMVMVAEGKPQPPNSLGMGRELVYLTAQQLLDKGRWDMILGDQGANVRPTDPLMIESIDPRMTGAPHPLGLPRSAIAAPGSNGNAINGAEQAVDPMTRDDLQFACVFDLQDSVACNTGNAAGCDCNKEEAVKQSPLCEYPPPVDGMPVDGTQIKAKAYPGVRELQVLKEVGDAAIVASICPKNPTAGQGMDPATDPYYGYNPAVAAIIERLKEALTAKCLPRPLSATTQADIDAGLAPPEELGKVPCAVVEVRPSAGGCGDCGAGRAPLMGEKVKVIGAVKDYMANQGQCLYDPPAGSQFPDCDNYCFCEIQQFTGAELEQCWTEGAAAGLSGYCYVDPGQAQASAESESSEGGVQVTMAEQERVSGMNELVASCKETERRVLRFLGNDLPAKDGLAVIACVGGAVSGL